MGGKSRPVNGIFSFCRKPEFQSVADSRPSSSADKALQHLLLRIGEEQQARIPLNTHKYGSRSDRKGAIS